MISNKQRLEGKERKRYNKFEENETKKMNETKKQKKNKIKFSRIKKRGRK